MLTPYLLTPQQLHGNFIFYKNCGFIFIGPPGSGKSMLSFQLIQKGAHLIADDIITLSSQRDDDNNNVYGHCPDLAFGFMEIFGLGIIELPSQQIKKRASIHHIFMYHKNPPRLLEEHTVCLLQTPIKMSFLNFSKRSSSDYIDAFCDYPRKNFS